MKLVGIRDGSYDAKDGQRIEGYNFYFTYEGETITGVGTMMAWARKRVGEVFLRDFDSIEQALGTECQVFYNRGKKTAAAIIPMQTAAPSRK